MIISKIRIKKLKIVNPISSDLGVLRNSIFSNLIIYMNKNLDRGLKDLSIFEIGPNFHWVKSWGTKHSSLWFISR